MNRLDIYISVLSEKGSGSALLLADELKSFIDRNARWRRYFETEVTADEANILAENLQERKVGLLGWLMVCGALSVSSVQNTVQQPEAA